MKQEMKKEFNFHFSEDLFDKAYIKYDDIKVAKSSIPKSKTAKSRFSWHKVVFHHISVGANKVDYLIHNEIVICSFPIKKDRNEIYEFLDKHWEERIESFCRYIDNRRKCE